MYKNRLKIRFLPLSLNGQVLKQVILNSIYKRINYYAYVNCGHKASLTIKINLTI